MTPVERISGQRRSWLIIVVLAGATAAWSIHTRVSSEQDLALQESRAAAASPMPKPPELRPWFAHRGDPCQQGVSPAWIEPDALTRLWTYKAGGPIRSSAVIFEGRVYVGCDDGSVLALDAATGTLVWAHETAGAVDAPPYLAFRRVFVGSADGIFRALDAATGREIWHYKTEGKILGSANAFPPARGQPWRLVVPSYDARLHCLDLETGRAIWTYATEGYIHGSPAVTVDSIIVGGCDGSLHVLSYNGELRARVKIGSYIAASIVGFPEQAFFGHYGNEFCAVDLVKGEVLWRYTAGAFPFVGAASNWSGWLVFGGRDQNVHCLNAKDGTLRWRFRTQGKIDGAPVITNSGVVIGSGDGRLYVLDLVDGKELWSYEVGAPIVAGPAIGEGIIVIGAEDGSVCAFAIDGRAPALRR